MNHADQYVSAENIEKDYYSFTRYNSIARMITYWYQIREALEGAPMTALEVGVGSGLVASYLKHCGVALSTLDINEELKPDIVGNVLSVQNALIGQTFDLVLCCRVLHHLPYTDFIPAVEQLLAVTNKRLVVTLPVNDIRLYGLFRYTSSKFYSLSIPLPIWVKSFAGRLLRRVPGSGLWMVNDGPQTMLHEVIKLAEGTTRLSKYYRISEDQSHLMLIFDK